MELAQGGGADQGVGAGRRGRPRVGGGRWWVGAQAGFAARVRAAEGGRGTAGLGFGPNS